LPDRFVKTPERWSERTDQRWSATERSAHATEQSVNATDDHVVTTERTQCVSEQRLTVPQPSGSPAAHKRFAPDRPTARTIKGTAELGLTRRLTKRVDRSAEHAHRRAT
jgi:hypothetical protein